jgi:sigma-B regulation protein RsbU (phosphoserine phosphatase)
VLGTIFNANVDTFSSGIQIALIAVSILFLIVEIGALVIGVSLARTITRAVHNLYQGTQRVTEGDFSHRIAVYGKDQLAALSTSFNAMTENLERLLVVAKEKERLQAEIEIAREVQNQLYPKVLPVLRTMTVAATCEPARMVSGDYYDYLVVPKGKLALAIGDVAGKGISAALLMATLQSAMRMELRTSSCIPTLPPVDGQVHVATAQLVSDLNQLLYATTAPEKYATFFFALYDEATSDLHYTNAGHLPPLLVRNGSAVPLDVNGTVVGAFPFSEYQESQVRMESGDLLVCYTDGITEPENEYGEMFGEERLIELVTKNADCEDSKLLAMILDAVHQWTSAAEQPDDMTLLLARKT